MYFRASKLARNTGVLAVLFAFAFALPVSAQSVSTIRVRLHPNIAAAGALPPDALAKLQALVGTGLSLMGTTRTGALDLALAEPQDSKAIAASLKALRNDRSVLWAETPRVASASPKATKALPAAAAEPGQRLLVRLKDDAAPDWSLLLPRLGTRLGTVLTVERQIGNVWVMSVALPQAPAQLARMAEELQLDGAVQYADPVKRVFTFAAPNDPFYPDAMVPQRSAFRRERRSRMVVAAELLQRCRRRGGHGHPAAPGSGRPRAARLRFHHRSVAGARR